MVFFYYYIMLGDGWLSSLTIIFFKNLCKGISIDFHEKKLYVIWNYIKFLLLFFFSTLIVHLGFLDKIFFLIFKINKLNN